MLGTSTDTSVPGPPGGQQPLDDARVETLRAVGREWSRCFGGRREPEVEVTDEVPPHRSRLRRALIGRPLRSAELATEKLGKRVALPVLSSDALSSVAYGPEAMLAVLVLAGAGGLGYSLPIAALIAFLMLATGVSYRQTIRAYPGGGGSYIVAGDNLGRRAGLVAAAGLITDYVLTVAVSVASGVAAVTSAVPSLASDRVVIGVGVIAILLAGNLRGVRQAGALFAAPTYAFIAAMAVLVVAGLVDAASRGFTVVAPPPVPAVEGIGVLLVLRAFSSGATAMTGIEAISNAVPVFKPPGWRNARTTLTLMAGILLAMFAGIVMLAHLDGVVPRPGETVLSQLAQQSFGGGPLYLFTQAATAAVLLLAANTAFSDFPRVLSLMARDSQAPHAFQRMSDRLAFSNGIAMLALASGTIFVAFDGMTAALIPLYAVGVFLAFALSQTGMVVHWRRHRGPHWRKSMVCNATGAALAAIVFLIAAATKFAEGAWVSIVVVAAVYVAGTRIRRHYVQVQDALALRPGAATAGRPEGEEIPEAVRHLIVVPVGTLDLASMRALAYAGSLGRPVRAVHVSPTQEEADRFVAYWRVWGDHVPLEVVVSPYRALIAPLVHYVETLRRSSITLTVVVPEVVVRRPWHRVLHGRTAATLRRALEPLRAVVVTTVPVHLLD